MMTAQCTWGRKTHRQIDGSVVLKFDNCGTQVWSIDVGQIVFGSELDLPYSRGHLYVLSKSLSNNKSYVSCFHLHGSSVWSYDMRLGNDNQVTGIGFNTGGKRYWLGTPLEISMVKRRSSKEQMVLS